MVSYMSAKGSKLRRLEVFQPRDSRDYRSMNGEILQSFQLMPVFKHNNLVYARRARLYSAKGKLLCQSINLL